MTPLSLLLLTGLGLIAGLSIGCIGIGGVILVPALTYLGGIPIQTAIAAAMMGYLLTGAVGTVMFARKKSIAWSTAGWLCCGALPAALFGAWASNNIPSLVLELVIGALTLTSGFQALRQKAGPEQKAMPLGPAMVVLTGALAGFISAITGTGGPLVLVPLLLWLGVPILAAIGLGQVIQLPIAALATVGNIAYGDPDFLIGGLLAIGLAGGSYLGARLAYLLPREALRRGVAVILILIGAAIVIRIASGLLAAVP